MHNPIPVSRIVEYLGNDIIAVYGNSDNYRVTYLRDLPHVDEFTLDWINPSRPEKQQMAEASKAKVIVANSEITYSERLQQQKKVILVVENPKLAVAKVGNRFFVKRPQPGIHPSAVVHPEAKLGKNVFVGPNATVGKCTIGDDVMIHANAVICDGIIIKNNVIIKPGAVLGSGGFGFEHNQNSELIKFPQVGNLIIEDNVEIGSNSTIDKGSLSNTIIGNGSKISSQCHISHNVILGKNVVITANVMISGSTIIEDNVWIAPNATLRGHRKIGKESIIGMGSVVTKDVPAGETWIGNPARKLNK